MSFPPRYPPKFTGELKGIFYTITDEERPLVAEYCVLMEEIKHRWGIADAVARGAIQIPQPAAGELCYLQLRMICELIALACLLAHGDIGGTRTKRVRNSADAEWIIKGMSRLHPSFYPLPSQQTVGDDGLPIALVEISDNFLTKANLLKLYAECGHFLHRGALKSVLDKTSRVPSKSRILSWCAKVVMLLNHHQIQLADKDAQLWVVLNDVKTLTASAVVARKVS